MKILITGGAGFIASHIVDSLLAQGHEVSILDNLSNGAVENINPAVKLYEISINNKLLESVFEKVKPEIVIHHAAQINVQASLKQPQDDAETNIIGTIALLQQCQRFGVRKIIYASSAAVYGSPKYLSVDEKHSIEPMSFYGFSKYVPEYYIKLYSDLYGLDFTILRYSNVYGPRQSVSGEGGVISTFINKFMKNETFYIYGDGNQTRDFIYVNDVVVANLAALHLGSKGTFNISTNKQTSVNDLYKNMVNIMESSIKLEYRTEKKGDIYESKLDNSQAISKLGWYPKYSVYEGLKETCEHYINKYTESTLR